MSQVMDGCTKGCAGRPGAGDDSYQREVASLASLCIHVRVVDFDDANQRINIQRYDIIKHASTRRHGVQLQVRHLKMSVASQVLLEGGTIDRLNGTYRMETCSFDCVRSFG